VDAERFASASGAFDPERHAAAASATTPMTENRSEPCMEWILHALIRATDGRQLLPAGGTGALAFVAAT
jgi:hypothetical protein